MDKLEVEIKDIAVLKGMTAYQYAVSQGYTGTEEEYAAACAEIAAYEEDYRETAEAATAAAEAAANAAEEASDAAAELRAQVSSPYLIAATAAAMTDTTKGYVYAGSETGYVKGGWYYHDGSAWVLGGTATDPTLSVSGAAADAKAAGNVKSRLNGLANLVPDDLLTGAAWEIGSINGSGQNASSSKRIRTSGYIEAEYASADFDITEGYRCGAAWYDASKAFLRFDYWVTEATTLFPPAGTKYMRVVVGLVTEATATLDYADEVSASGRGELMDSLANSARSADNPGLSEALARGWIPYLADFENGNIQNGADSDASKGKRLRSGFIPTAAVTHVLSRAINPTKVYFVYYDADLEYQTIVDTGPKNSEAVIDVDTSYPWMRMVMISYSDTTHQTQINISPQDAYDGLILYLQDERAEAIVRTRDDTFEGLREQLGEMSRRVSVLEAAAGIDAVPDYYADYIAAKADTINTLADELTSGAQFIFATDYHGVPYGGKYYATHHMQALINYLVENTGISLTVNGGDNLNSNQGAYSRAKFLRYMRKISQYFMPDDYAVTLFAAGNHDLGCDGMGSSGVSDPVISEDDLYINSGLAAIASKVTRDGHTPFNYYYDSNGAKIRYIVLLTENMAGWGFGNTGYANDFLAESLLGMETGWTAVVIYHWPFGASAVTAQTNTIAAIMASYNARGSYGGYDFSGGAGTAACIIGGHQHYDNSAVLEPLSGYKVPVIMTTTACCTGEAAASSNTREAGTVTEEAFDVFTIDTTAKTITATRIGGGSDRSWTY